jgi:hypothetical protein
MQFVENRTFLNSFPKSWERLFRPGQDRPGVAKAAAGTEGRDQSHRRCVKVIDPNQLLPGPLDHLCLNF